MRVLYLTNIPSPYRVDFFNELGKLCELTVIFERREALNRSNGWYGKKHDNFISKFLKGVNIGDSDAFCPSIIKWLTNKKFDIFVIGGYSTPTGIFAIEILNLKGIPFFINSDGGMIKNDGFLNKLFKKHLIGSASYWLSSGLMTNDYQKHYGAKENKIYTYPFTSLYESEILKAPIDFCEKMELRKKLELNYTRLFLSIGQFIDRKGFDILIKAFQVLKDEKVGLVIIGGGKQKDNYSTIINRLNTKNIHLVDFKVKSEILEYYSCCDIFVLPTREDIWGLVINEAMSRGLPVISTNKCVAAVELIKNDKNGYIVEVDNINELYERIKELAYAQQDKLDDMGKESINVIKDYTIENMAKRHFEVFRRTLTTTTSVT